MMTKAEEKTQQEHVISLALRLCDMAEEVINAHLKQHSPDLAALFEHYTGMLLLARLGQQHGLTDQGTLMLIQSSDQLSALVVRELRAQVRDHGQHLTTPAPAMAEAIEAVTQ